MIGASIAEGADAHSRVILVLVDGLRDDVAARDMGVLEGWVAAGLARRWRLSTVLPSLSRPIYASLFTGRPPQEHGILGNGDVRRLDEAMVADSVFAQARAAGRTTAAVAYSWFAEIFNGAPYDPVMDREQTDGPGPIQTGRYYTHDSMPDKEVFEAAALVIRRHAPDLLLVHPMSLDDTGHRAGGESPAYAAAAAGCDALMGRFLPAWRAEGYHVLVTADHGMDARGSHGGTAPEVTTVPLYHLPPDDRARAPSASGVVSQLCLAPSLMTLLGLPIPPAMRHPPLPGLDP